MLFDFGATVNGYHSDITRTFFIGQASEEDKNMYETVLKANTHGRKITYPNLSMNDLDDQVLRILEESSYINNQEIIYNKKEEILNPYFIASGLDINE